MKKTLYLLLVASLVFVVSVNTSFAQQEKERTKIELDEAKLIRAKADVRRVDQKKVDQREIVQKKYKLKARPIKQKAIIKTKPAERKVIEK